MDRRHSSYTPLSKTFRPNSWSSPIQFSSSYRGLRTYSTKSTTIFSIQPIVPSTTTSPPLFLTEIPFALVDKIPAPTFRSHILELNRILGESHSSRAVGYSRIKIFYVAVLFVLLVSVVICGILENVIAVIVLSLLFIILLALIPLLRNIWFTAFLGTVSRQVQKAVKEWNARSDALGVKFKVVGLYEDEGEGLEFQVIVDNAFLESRGDTMVRV